MLASAPTARGPTPNPCGHWRCAQEWFGSQMLRQKLCKQKYNRAHRQQVPRPRTTRATRRNATALAPLPPSVAIDHASVPMEESVPRPPGRPRKNAPKLSFYDVALLLGGGQLAMAAERLCALGFDLALPAGQHVAVDAQTVGAAEQSPSISASAGTPPPRLRTPSARSGTSRRARRQPCGPPGSSPRGAPAAL